VEVAAEGDDAQPPATRIIESALREIIFITAILSGDS
jgi:hypothetical protein